ncbi:unnamed protein product [Diamesa serratosioi]
MENAPPLKSNEANLEELNKRTVEIKRKIVLSEGQKKANIEEWDAEKKQFTDKIKDFKKDIKSLSSKLKFLHNPSKKNQKLVQQDLSLQSQKKVPLPKGAQSCDDGVRILDLQIIDLKKQNDLYHAKLQKKQQLFDKLTEEYNKLDAYKNEKSTSNTHPPETVEEDANRKVRLIYFRLMFFSNDNISTFYFLLSLKLITRLENEIHKTEVQWTEAEHIRKKYRSIKSSLMMDSEKFESTLLQLEHAIREQQHEINQLNSVHQEAQQMRDTTKSILSKQEQTTISSSKTRDRQAQEFRRQVEERKSELERLERKIFATGTKIIHQESGASSGRIDDDDALARDNKATMDAKFKKLMTATGVTVSHELVDRFLAQREASARLTYLRNVTENDKKQLESQREVMTQQLDVFKFSDNRESEVNQEELEKVKKEIEDHKKRKRDYDREAAHTNTVLQSIKDALVEMLLKLQELDEMTVEIQSKKKQTMKASSVQVTDLISGNISSEQLIRMLEDKVKFGMIAAGQLADNIDSGLSDDDIDDGKPKPNATPSAASTNSEDKIKTPSVASFAMDEKPPTYPQVYASLITGRSTGLVSASPGGGPGAGSEEEADVPSRSFLKRQANLILDAKSRRKYRPAARRK